MRVFRQGDIIFREVEELPEGEVTGTDDKVEISGETGHLHTVTKVKVIEIDWNKFVKVPEDGATMTHPEHPPLELPPLLVARVDRVRSVTPYLD